MPQPAHLEAPLAENACPERRPLLTLHCAIPLAPSRGWGLYAGPEAPGRSKVRTKKLPEIARRMRGIHFAMLMTHGPRGQVTGRPMSNNRGVKYNGESHYFTWGTSQLVRDIDRNAHVALVLQGRRSVLGKPGIYISIEGIAKIVRSKSAFHEHWNRDLDRWFPEGVDTEGLVMITVQARRVDYWDGRDEGQIKVS
jgi:general stress protein 26